MSDLRFATDFETLVEVDEFVSTLRSFVDETDWLDVRNFYMNKGIIVYLNDEFKIGWTREELEKFKITRIYGGWRLYLRPPMVKRWEKINVAGTNARSY